MLAICEVVDRSIFFHIYSKVRDIELFFVEVHHHSETPAMKVVPSSPPQRTGGLTNLFGGTRGITQEALGGEKMRTLPPVEPSSRKKSDPMIRNGSAINSFFLFKNKYILWQRRPHLSSLDWSTTSPFALAQKALT